MIDSHCHLNRKEFAADRAAVLAAAASAGVTGFLNVGYDPATSRSSVELAAGDPRILATVGVHPHDAALLADADGTLRPEAPALLAELEALAAHPRVVAVGEIGLDFYRDLSPRPAQRTALAAQLALADRVDKPVVFHVRDAWAETLALVDELGVPRRRGVLHAFAGDARAVDWARERGFLLGIGGPVTYKNSTLPDLVRRAGLGMLLLETDAPWLPPVPHRGQRNEPAYVALTCAKVAQVLDTTPAAVAAATTANFRELCGGATALAPEQADAGRPSQLALLKRHGIRPVKRRGQNFLVDGNLARAIAADIVGLGDRVLELGAGGGALTAPLLDGGAAVTAVEVDRHLCALLTAELGGRPTFRLLEADLAKLDWTAVIAAAGPRPVVAGNLPYVLTSTVLFALAERHAAVAGGVFMVQREVAERITAAPGGRDYGVLAVVLGAVFTPAIVRTVPATVFWPQPGVESAIVRLTPRTAWDPGEFAAFTATVKTLFGQRRKKLATQLRKHYALDAAAVGAVAAAAGVDPEARPEQVDGAGWRRLAAALAARGDA